MGEFEILKAPFPWFGGKSRVSPLVWERFGDVGNYVEPFAGSLAVLLGRPGIPGTETVNDLDCVAPPTRMLMADLTWKKAGKIKVGDQLIGFDESNGEAREGLRAPKRYRRLAKTTVTGVRRLRKPCYRLTFDDGTTVVSSADHLWLGGSHKSGGRGWRWVKTAHMVCNRKNQRSWVLKVAEVVDREETWESGWLAGFLDGEGHLNAGPGLRVTVSQNEGPTLDHAAKLLNDRGITCEPSGKRRCKALQINGGIVTSLSLLMRFRPRRLIKQLNDRLGHISLYGRSHRAVGLISKEFLGEQEVVAIETDCHTFIAEGLASHNCFLANFWRCIAFAPEECAAHADWPVNEADLHARHLWLVNQEAFRERMKTDPEYFDPKIAGWWVWGISQWIGSGWCSRPDWTGRTNAGTAERGIFATRYENSADWNVRPHLSPSKQGINADRMQIPSRQIPSLRGDSGAAGQGIFSARVSGPDRKRPMTHGGHKGRGVHAENPGVSSQFGKRRQEPPLAEDGSARVWMKRPDIADGGRGVHGQQNHSALYSYFEALAHRLRRVRVCCGDWMRVLGPSVTVKHGICGIFLDPPYDMRVVSSPDSGRDGAAPTDGLYANHDNDLSKAVREWAIENGNNPLLRIALCGYESEHKLPDTWTCVPWKAHGGYGSQRGNQGYENSKRERIWFSPHCLSGKQSRLEF